MNEELLEKELPKEEAINNLLHTISLAREPRENKRPHDAASAASETQGTEETKPKERRKVETIQEDDDSESIDEKESSGRPHGSPSMTASDRRLPMRKLNRDRDRNKDIIHAKRMGLKEKLERETVEELKESNEREGKKTEKGEKGNKDERQKLPCRKNVDRDQGDKINDRSSKTAKPSLALLPATPTSLKPSSTSPTATRPKTSREKSKEPGSSRKEKRKSDPYVCGMDGDNKDKPTKK